MLGIVPIQAEYPRSGALDSFSQLFRGGVLARQSDSESDPRRFDSCSRSVDYPYHEICDMLIKSIRQYRQIANSFHGYTVTMRD